MIDIHIDLETLDTVPKAKVTQIGIVAFDRELETIVFQLRFDLVLEPQEKRTISIDTLRFWAQQDPVKFYDTLSGYMYPEMALQKIADQINGLQANPDEVTVWGNGATFDISILEDLYRDNGIQVPWKFWQIRDCRTVVDLARMIGIEKPEPDPNKVHDPLYDAEFQGTYTVSMIKALTHKKDVV